MGIAGTVGALAVIFGGFASIDSIYARASDLHSITRSLEVNRLQSEISVLELRKSSVQDKVYEGAARRTRSIAPAEMAISQRYAAELADVERQITAKRELIDRLKTGARP